MKQLLIIITITAVTFSCTKPLSITKKEQNQFHTSISQPDFISVFDIGDGDTITPAMNVKIWYTDTFDTSTMAKTFIEDANDNSLMDLENNPKSAFYLKSPAKTFSLTINSYNHNKEIQLLLQEHKYVMAEIELVATGIDPGPDPMRINYNWLYLTYINKNKSQHFQIKCDALRAGL